MRTIYRYRKSSPWPAVLALLASGAVWVWALFAALTNAGAWMSAFRIAGGATIAFVFLATIFSSMTIVVGDERIAWWFGLGFPRAHLALENLADASATRGAFWQGWGTHLAGRGLWSLRGLNAVRLRTPQRRSVILGTQRPQELLDAIARARWGERTVA